MEQWAPLLRAEGVSVTFSTFLDASGHDILYRRGHVASKVRAIAAGYARRVRELTATPTFDVAYVFRRAALLGTTWVERLVGRRCPFVFDFDDAIYLPSTSDANRAFGFLKRPAKVRTVCRIASAVTVGNDTLAAFARRYNPLVEIIPSTIDTDAYRVTPRAANQKPVVGWTGSATTAPYLRTLAPALRQLRQRCDFELLVIGPPMAIDGLDVRSIPWRADTEADDVRRMDVGLMPLTDDDWSRAKCALKALQYMALGIPPVVSPVGTNVRVVQDGVNGFHARTDAEWADRIAALLHDPELRARLGRAARATVEQEYSGRVQAPRLAAVFRRVHATAHGIV